MKKYTVILTMAFVLGITGCQKQTENPNNVDKGMMAIEQEYYQEALASFEAAVSENEDLASAYRGMGMAHMGLGEYQKAVDFFDQALAQTDEKMERMKKDILYYKASSLYCLKDYAGTIAVCEAILKIAGEGDAYYLIGSSYLELEEKEKATVNFDNAVAIQPEDYDLYLNIYEGYNEKKLSAEGDVYLQKALAIESKGDEDAYQKARIYYYLGNYEKAQEQLAMLTDKKNPEALLLLGKVYLALGDTAHSRNIYGQYMAEYGETPSAYNGIVLADLADEDYDAALANAQKGLALEQEKGKKELSYNQIVAYEGKKDFISAKEKAGQYAARYPADSMGRKENEFLQSR